MNTKIYSIYDEASQAYMMPFFSPQNASAIRAVVTQLKDPNSMLAHNPEDFTLYCIGGYNDQTGLIDNNMQNPELIGKLVDYVGALALSDTNDAHREQPDLYGNRRK